MPRPKGSKNKKTISQSAAVAVPVIENIDQITKKITAVEAEIAAIGEQLKAKKEAKEEAEAAAKKAEEDKNKVLEAFQASGKSVEELVAFLKGEYTR